jgi:hypothetical protein
LQLQLLRYTGLADTDGADGGAQSSPFDSPATVSLAAVGFDRLSSNELIMTQEFTANMLGVREGVTRRPETGERRLDSHNRGRITVL